MLGVRTFVVDSAGELAKFRNVPAHVSLLIRLADSRWRTTRMSRAASQSRPLSAPCSSHIPPTCDSADVVARRYPLPRLREGDLLLSHAMGAYTAVSATTFNGRRPARVIVRDPVTLRGVDDQALLTSSR